jgi:uncharacterized Zn-finger protein
MGRPAYNPSLRPLSRGPIVASASACDGGLIEPNAENRYDVTRADLPLSCPMPGMQLWNSHPRVYLPIEKSGWAKCPYCSAEYFLKV